MFQPPWRVVSGRKHPSAANGAAPRPQPTDTVRAGAWIHQSRGLPRRRKLDPLLCELEGGATFSCRVRQSGMAIERTVLEDSWLRLFYIVDGVGQRHYEPVGSLFRAGDEVQASRLGAGVVVEGYGMREVWRRLEAEQEEAA